MARSYSTKSILIAAECNPCPLESMERICMKEKTKKREKLPDRKASDGEKREKIPDKKVLDETIPEEEMLDVREPEKKFSGEDIQNDGIPLEDIALKVSADYFGKELPPEFGIEGEITAVTPTEEVSLEVVRKYEDW